jgi:dual 3',5'-cyclic-AMP and -GMP phosphodiesterase 11
VVHDLFEEQTSVDAVVSKIMQRAQSLLKCEHCSMLLKDMNDTDVSIYNRFRAPLNAVLMSER